MMKRTFPSTPIASPASSGVLLPPVTYRSKGSTTQIAVMISLGVLLSGCASDLDAEDPLVLAASSGGVDDELTSESGEPGLGGEDVVPLGVAPAPSSSRSCTQDNDCRSPCLCLEGTCDPSPGVGPQPPAGYCDEAPTRSCSVGSDCRDGCICSSGICSPGGVGPLSPTCHLPPTDQYEYDDKWYHHSNYVGPQLHNFIDASDKDWTAVYIGAPGLVRFQTHSLSSGTDTRMKVFAYDGVSKGVLLGSNDDIGGPWYWPDSKSSRVDLQVAAGSSFLIKVINESDPSLYTTSHQLPSYTLELSYL